MRAFRIERELRPRDLDRFQRLVTDRRYTIDDLVEWLHKRGYQICRSSVGDYAKLQRERHAFQPPWKLGKRSDQELREIIRKAGATLSGDRLMLAAAVMKMAMEGASLNGVETPVR